MSIVSISFLRTDLSYSLMVEKSLISCNLILRLLLIELKTYFDALRKKVMIHELSTRFLSNINILYSYMYLSNNNNHMYLQLDVNIFSKNYRQNPNQSSGHSYDISNIFPYFKNSIQCIHQNVVKIFLLSVNERIRWPLVIKES